jgi:hypothetical protein
MPASRSPSSLPPLQLTKKAERRHAGVRIPAADSPEQSAIALCLHGRLGQVGRFRRACALAISGERGYGYRRRDGAPPVRGKGSTSPSCTTSRPSFTPVWRTTGSS